MCEVKTLSIMSSTLFSNVHCAKNPSLHNVIILMRILNSSSAQKSTLILRMPDFTRLTVLLTKTFPNWTSFKLKD